MVLIDFGLSSSVSHSAVQRLPEEKAVDLYVFERALVNALKQDFLDQLALDQSPDFSSPERLMGCVIDSYRQSYADQVTSLRQEDGVGSGGKSKTTKQSALSREALEAEVKANLSKLEEVRLRGRKRSMVG